jgi:hypothetical protein
MNEPNKSVETVSTPQGRASAWWKVRPILQMFLLAEAAAVVALLTLDATSAATVRAWFRPVAITLEQVQAVVTFLAIVSLLAVVIEALRTGRMSSRRSHGEMKAASVS